MRGRSLSSRLAIRLAGAGILLLSLATGARAQTACRTPNCAAPGSLPAACQNRATPHTPTVLLTTSGLNFVFLPANPKIEPGECILWQAASVIHSSSADPCPDDVGLNSCTAASPPTCLWDSGNVSSTGAPPTVVCAYDPAVYPAGTGDGYYCRIHDNPAHTGTMHGTLMVTTPIVLLVDKSGTDVKLTWTGGGVTGDVTYKVVRSNNGDPTFATVNTTTLNPDGGVTGTTFTDVGELTNNLTRYYLTRNKQTNE